jgi:ketosteroid isomerase-like protein
MVFGKGRYWGDFMSRFLASFTLALIASTTALAGAADDIVAADKAFSALSAAKGSNAAFLAYMADDARVFGTGNEPPIFGKAEAVKRFAKSGNGDPKTNVLSWVPDHAEASKDGTVGYSDGHWLFEAPKARLTGHYMTVWRKVGRAWKVIADMGTTDAKK